MSKPIHKDPQAMCPLWRKPCTKVCHTCEWYVHLSGKHPQTLAPMDDWKCSIAWLPILHVEHSQMQLRTTETVDALRKEVHQANDQAMVGTLGRLNEKMDAALESQVGLRSPAHKLLES